MWRLLVSLQKTCFPTKFELTKFNLTTLGTTLKHLVAYYTEFVLECERGWLPTILGNRKLCSKLFMYKNLEISEARQFCADLGAKLPLPENREELVDFFDHYPISLYIDGTYKESDGVFLDSSGDPVNFLAGATPNPVYGQLENQVWMI